MGREHRIEEAGSIPIPIPRPMGASRGDGSTAAATDLGVISLRLSASARALAFKATRNAGCVARDISPHRAFPFEDQQKSSLTPKCSRYRGNPKTRSAYPSAHERRRRSDPRIGEREMSREAQSGTGGGLEGNFTTEAQRPQRTASEGKPTVTVPPLLALPCLLTEERFFPTHSEKDRFEGLRAGSPSRSTQPRARGT